MADYLKEKTKNWSTGKKVAVAGGALAGAAVLGVAGSELHSAWMENESSQIASWSAQQANEAAHQMHLQEVMEREAANSKIGSAIAQTLEKDFSQARGVESEALKKLGKMFAEAAE